MTIVSGHFFKNPLKKRILHFSGLLQIFVYQSAHLDWQKHCTIEQNGFYQDRLKPPIVRRPLTTRPIPLPLPLPPLQTITITITDHYKYRA